MKDNKKIAAANRVELIGRENFPGFTEGLITFCILYFIGVPP